MSLILQCKKFFRLPKNHSFPQKNDECIFSVENKKKTRIIGRATLLSHYLMVSTLLGIYGDVVVNEKTLLSLKKMQ